MTDISTVSVALSSLKTATEIVSFFRQSDVSLEKAEYKMKLADLVGALADIKTQLANLQEAAILRDEKIRDLENQLKIKGQIEWAAPYYWLNDNGTKHGPFCQQCYDNQSKLIRLQNHGDGHWECKTCKNPYSDGSSRERVLVAETEYDPFD